MPLPDLSALTTALRLGHLSTTLTIGANLPEVLQRQVRHVAYEFMQLKEEHFGPNSGQAEPEEWATAAEALMSFYGEALGRGTEEARIVEQAKLASATLREIRTLNGGQHFFSETLDDLFRALAMLGVDYDQFASALVWELHKYRQQRDEEESRFLKPFHDYSGQLMAAISGVRSQPLFTHFNVKNRIKRDLLTKMVARDWKHMQEFYDLVGLRLLVGNQREVDAAVALIEGALRVHESSMMLDASMEHYFSVDHVEHKVCVAQLEPALHVEDKAGYFRKSYNDRGYRGKHINVRRHCRENGHTHPTAEIQVMSRGIEEWGDTQRLLIYKGDDIPAEVKNVINGYCRSVADYIVDCENGVISTEYPDSWKGEGILILNRIDDETHRSEVFDRLSDMDAMMGRYREEAAKRTERLNERTLRNKDARH